MNSSKYRIVKVRNDEWHCPDVQEVIDGLAEDERIVSVYPTLVLRGHDHLSVYPTMVHQDRPVHLEVLVERVPGAVHLAALPDASGELDGDPMSAVRVY